MSPKDESGNSWIKNSFGKIVSKDNIDSYIEELDLDSAKENVTSILNHKKLVDDNKASWQDYFDTCKDGNEYIIDTIKNTDDLSKLTGEDLVAANQEARASAIAHNEALKQQTLGAKAAELGMKALAMAGNMLLSFAASFVVSKVAEKLYATATAAKTAKENSESLATSLSKMQSEYAENSSKIDELSKKYDELSSGVNDAGLNVSLTSSQYDEYKSVIKQLSEIMPELTTRFNEQGEAIGFVGGKLKDTKKKYQEYRQDQAINFLGEGKDGKTYDDIVDNLNNQEELGVGQTLASVFSNLFNSKKGAIESMSNKEKIDKIDKIVDVYNKSANSKEAYDSILENGDISFLSGLLDKSKGEIDDLKDDESKFKDLIKDLVNERKILSSSLESSANSTKLAMVEVANSDDEYWSDKLGDTGRSYVSSVLSGISYDFLNEEELNTKKSQQSFVTNLIDTIKNNKGNVNEAFASLFELNLDDMNIDDAREKIQQYCSIIAEVLEISLPQAQELLGYDAFFGTAENYDKVVAYATDGSYKSAKDVKNSKGFDEKQILDLMDKYSINSDEEIDNFRELLEKSNTISELESKLANKTTSSFKSFKEAWADLDIASEDSGMKDTKQDLLDLAEAGKLTEKTFKEVSGSDTFLDEIGISSKEAVDNINHLVESTKQLSSMKTGISSIREAYSTRKDNKNKLGADTLSSMYDTLGIDDWSDKDKKVWTEYKNAAEDTSVSMDEFKKKQDALATSFVNTGNYLGGITKQSKERYVAMLKEMGIINAEEVATKALEVKTKTLKETKDKLGISSKELKSINLEEADALDDLNLSAEDAGKALYDYMIQKIQCGDIKLDTATECANLYNLALKAGIATNKLRELLNAQIQYNTYERVSSNVKGLQDVINSADDENKKITFTTADGDVKEFKNKQSATNQLKGWGTVAKNAKSRAEENVKKFNKKNKVNLDVDVQTQKGSSKDKDKNSSSKDKSKSTQVIDWIERRLNRLNSTIDYTTSKLQNMFTIKQKSNEIDKQIKTSTKLINAYGIAADKYKKKANQVAKPSTKTVTNSKGKKKKKKVSGLSDGLIKNIQNGKLKSKSLSKLIATYGEDTAEKIQSYQDYWDKYQDALKNKQDEIAKKRQYQIDQIQLDIDNSSEISAINDAKKENAKSANEKNSILNNEINNLGKYYEYQKKLVQIQYGKKSEKALNELARLEEERKKKLNDIAIEQHQNTVDELNRNNDSLEAQKQNLKTAVEKNAVIEQQKPIVEKTYAEQIAIAKLQYGNNSDEVKKLQEEQKSKLNDLAIEQHQNIVDELDRNNEALEAQKQNLKTASEKNAIVDQQKAIAQQTYAEQIEIAKLQYGDGSDEVKKLQEEQKSKLADFENEKFENIQTEYGNWLDMIQARIDGLDGSISIVEAKGITATQGLYQGKVAVEKENLSTLQAEKAALEEQHKSTEVGTALWYSQEKTLNDVSTAIINAQKNMIEYRKSIREANDQVLELKKSFITLGNIYLDNFEKYLSRYSLTDEDTGGLTDKGVTALGVYRKQSISAGEQQKIDMDKLNEIEDIITRYNIYDDTQKKILLDANNYDSFAQVKEDYEKYAQAVQDDISNRISAEENIINLMKERYNAELSYIQKLIDDRKQQLSDEKDLYDYQKSIQEKVDNISLLQKQLDALRNDGSEEAMQRRNNIQDQLDNAKEDLMDVEYDKYISDQQNMLDQLSEDYQNLIEDLLKDVDTLLAEGNEIAKNNGKNFETAINNFADKYNETTFTNQQGDVAKIKDAVEKEQEDQKAANEVLSAIEKIGTVDLDGEGRKRLVDAENLYKSLTDAQRKIVDENPNGLELLNKKRQEWEALQKPAPAPEPDPEPTPIIGDAASEVNPNYGADKVAANNSNGVITKGLVESLVDKYGKKPGKKKTEYGILNQYVWSKTKGKKIIPNEYFDNIRSGLGLSKTASQNDIIKIMKQAGFSKGGIVETLSKVPGRNGDDGWATLKRGEAILTPEQTKMFQSMIKQMPVFTNAMDIFSSTKASAGVNNKPNSVSVGDINLTLDLPNVTNPESFIKEMQSNSRMRKVVQQAVLDEVVGKGNLNIKRL